MKATAIAAAVGCIAAASIAAAQDATDPRDAEIAALKQRVTELETQIREKNVAVRAYAQRVKRIRWTAKRATLARQNIAAAIRIASITHGVPEWQMRRIAFCESRLTARAVNPSSSASGLFQFLPSTWRAYPYGRAGLSVFDPYANAMQAAYVVRHDGGWRQWECKL